jgi:hypothetical protein
MNYWTLIKAIAWGVKEDAKYMAGNVQMIVKDFKDAKA